MPGFSRRRSAATLGLLFAVAIGVVVAVAVRVVGSDGVAPAVLPSAVSTTASRATGSMTVPTSAPRPTLAAALASASAAEGRFDGWTEARIALGERCLRVVVADEPGERNQGLRGVVTPSPYDGMLFLLAEDSDGPFTMSGVPVDLDIGWYDAQGRPVDRARMTACPDGTDATCPLYRSSRQYRVALETLAGGLGGGALGGCGA